MPSPLPSRSSPTPIHSLHPSSPLSSLSWSYLLSRLAWPFSAPRSPPLPRAVHVNLPLPALSPVGPPPPAFPSNLIRTSKYSLWSFVPKNLSHQFKRIANLYFLLLCILQFLPKFSQVSPFLASLPLLCVLAITALKDAYEDFRRHQADRLTNSQPILVLDPALYSNPNHTLPVKPSLWSRLSPAVRSPNSPAPCHSLPRPHWSSPHLPPSLPPPSHNHPSSLPPSSPQSPALPGFVLSSWAQLKVGDFVLITNNQSVPADVVICSTSDPEENVCFVETKNLDGETNLKSRCGLSQLSFLRSAKDCIHPRPDHMNRFVIECEAPDPDLYSYRAALAFPHQIKPSGNMHHTSQHNPQTLRVPIQLNSVLLRGTVLRNTEWVIGLVIMTGVDTKIMLNSSGTPSKRSKVEKQMNPMVFINLAILALMCLFNAIGTHFFERYYYRRNSYWTYGSNLSDDNPNINGVIGFVYAMITYQNIVPISLYISIEFVRTVQAYLIWADDSLQVNGLRTLARSWNLSDDLGQIQYIFSDKTGTLTQNLMQFRQCSIGGRVYRGSLSKPLEENQESKHGESGQRSELELGEVDIEEDATLIVAHRQGSSGPGLAKEHSDSTAPSPRSLGNLSTDRVIHAQHDVPLKLAPSRNTGLEPFHDFQLFKDLGDTDSIQSRLIHGFFATLGLCHTVLANEDDQGSVVYNAQSPDEAALVQTAADVGFVFRGRDRNVLRLEVPRSDGCSFTDLDGVDKTKKEVVVDSREVNEYELLDVVEFTSSRKRMSVIVRRLVDSRDQSWSSSEDPPSSRDSHELYLLVKGADSVIFDRLEPGQALIKEATDVQLEEFARQGLRTLCLAYRRLDWEEVDRWQERYAQANSTLGADREKVIAEVQDELERDLILLGATAIEDKLQDGVPESIHQLKQAGIKVWVATGDKLETAVAIAKSCNLISPDMNLIVVKGGAYGERASAYDQIKRALIDFFDGSELVDQLKEKPPDYEKIIKLDSEKMQRGISSNSQEDIRSIVGSDNGNRNGGYGLVIDGGSLKHSLSEKFTQEALLELATRCSAVVCCRTSPKQKAQIVRMVKEGFNNHVQTLAIGDGANDVSMIQAADIGVGVRGEEGLQAINSSDYAIGQFKFLNRLLFVHGHWSYVRNSKMINNFFYKEIVGVAVLWLYQFWCGYSTTILNEYTYILFFNVFWTLLPVIGIGVFDQDIRDKVLMQVPQLYSTGRDSKLFNISQFLLYMAEGTYQGFIIFLLVTFSYNTTSARKDGFDVGMNEFSTVIIVGVVWGLNLFNGLDQAIWNYWLCGFVLFGPVLILLYTAVYSALKPGWIWTTVYGNNDFLWQAPYWWLGLVISIVVCLLPRLVCKYIQEVYYPTDVQILRGVDIKNPSHSFVDDKRVNPSETRASLSRSPSVTVPTPNDHPKDPEKAFPLSSPRQPDTDAPTSNMTQVPAVGVPRGSPLHELIRSGTSLTHDMATGQLSASTSRGFNFDQADDVGANAVGDRLRRYNTSFLSVERQASPANLQPSSQQPGRGSTIRERTGASMMGNLQLAFGALKSSTLRNGRSTSRRPSVVARSDRSRSVQQGRDSRHGGEDERSSSQCGTATGSQPKMLARVSGFFHSQQLQPSSEALPPTARTASPTHSLHSAAG